MTIAETKINGRDTMEVVQNFERVSQVSQVKEAEIANQSSQEANSLTTRDVTEILDSFQDLSQTIQTKLNFSVHEENNEIIVRVLDKETNQLIRQFPSDEMLELQDKMRDLAGFLLNANV
ncbi:flagellar protein FlaG [Desulfospira joergensenii]|uniref:flagellar protein FlaG n=1 Tax=Desulfospira joergensenii TaxID=53329 RepID=UPI0003B3FCC6|nr:flagellar protein FlaG [Desulfospira joergensenii]